MAKLKKRSNAKKQQKQPEIDYSVIDEVLAEEPVDSQGFRPYQRRWQRQVWRKDANGIVVYLFAIALAIFSVDHSMDLQPPMESHTIFGPVSPEFRIGGTFACTVVALVTIYIDVIFCTPPEAGDNKWYVLLDGHAGHFSYLTFNILFAHAVYWPLCLVSETMWYLDESFGETRFTEHFRRILILCYMSAVFCATLGVTLTVLFLKFNWYEPSWRKEVLELYHSRGQTSFGAKMLFTHLNQTALAFIDIFILKDDVLLRKLSLSTLALAIVAAVYNLLYISWTHANYKASGGRYPYPVFHQMLSSWSVEIKFVVAVASFTLLLGYAFNSAAIHY